MKKYDVSVIIPVYNAEKTLNRCIDSLINQTIINQMELIFVNDGSSDDSTKTIKEYQQHHNNIKLINQKNAGPGAARNNGIKKAKGKYIGFVDADDYIAQNMYEKMVKEMEKSEEIDYVMVGRYNVVNNKKTAVINEPVKTGLCLSKNKWILSHTSTFIWDKLFKREIIIKNEIEFPVGYHYAEDYYFLAVYKYYANRIANIQEPLYYYLSENKSSITNTCNETWFDIIKILEMTNNFFIENGEFQKHQYHLLRSSMGFFCRRVKAFKVSNNKRVQVKFVKLFHEYFEYYFDNWKPRLEKYGVKKPKKYRTNIHRMKIYIYTPNIIKVLYQNIFIYMKSMPTKIKNVPNTIKLKREKLSKNVNLLKTRRVYYAYYRKFLRVKKNRIFFMSYFGGNITDSPYYMMKDMVKDQKYEIYVASRQPKADRLYLDFNNIKDVEIVKVHSKKFVKLLATSEYIVNNSRVPEYVIKRSKQVFVNTWHGTPLKTLGRKINNGLKDLGNNQTQFLMCDYLLYPNEHTRKHMMEDFCLENLYSGKVIVSGYPRNEIFFDKNRSKYLKEKRKLTDKKVFVYMPTWRGKTLDTSDIEEYKNELETILKELDNNIQNAIIYVKLHQIVMKHINISDYKNIKPINTSYETYDFLNMADALITDYSSVFFDYANSGKEIILFMYDYDQYMQDRGMYFNVKDLPFTKVYNTKDLIKEINTNKKFSINKKYKEFLTKFCYNDSINNSKVTNDIIFRNNLKDKNNLILDYTNNNEKKHKVIFCTNLNSIEKQYEFNHILNKIDNNTILVFKQETFTDTTNNIIHANDDKIKNYIVIPDKMPLSIKDKLVITLYRKFKICKHSCKKIYKREINRILPGIKIDYFQNYTKDQKLKDITKLFNKKKKNIKAKGALIK